MVDHRTPFLNWLPAMRARLERGPEQATLLPVGNHLGEHTIRAARRLIWSGVTALDTIRTGCEAPDVPLVWPRRTPTIMDSVLRFVPTAVFFAPAVGAGAASLGVSHDKDDTNNARWLTAVHHQWPAPPSESLAAAQRAPVVQQCRCYLAPPAVPAETRRRSILLQQKGIPFTPCGLPEVLRAAITMREQLHFENLSAEAKVLAFLVLAASVRGSTAILFSPRGRWPDWPSADKSRWVRALALRLGVRVVRFDLYDFDPQDVAPIRTICYRPVTARGTYYSGTALSESCQPGAEGW